MAKFSAAFSKAQPQTNVGVMSIETAASAPRRIKVSELVVGSDSTTLGTSAWRFDWQRSTSSATGATVTPTALDPADVTFTSLVRNGLTANGTLVGSPFTALPLMQQATFRWAARDGSEIVVPAANANGLHLLTPVAGGNQSVAGYVVAEE